jgi:hypothetical protein
MIDRLTVSHLSVKPKSRIAGKTIEAAELRGLTGLYLFEVRRGDQLYPAPARDFALQEADVLVFTGNVSSVKDLWLTEGLAPATNQVLKISGSESRQLIEAVVRYRCREAFLLISCSRSACTAA